MATYPLLSRAPQGMGKLKWLHYPCLLGVPIVVRNQYGCPCLLGVRVVGRNQYAYINRAFLGVPLLEARNRKSKQKVHYLSKKSMPALQW